MTLGGLSFLQPMSLFAHTRTRRRTAIVMLGAWVLALLVGIANACALGKPAPSHTSGERQTTLAAHGHDAHASAGPEPAGGTDGSRPLKQACQKFCDDEAATVVKHDKAFKVAAMATSTTAVAWWLPSSVALPTRARPGAAPPPEAPLTMRFMRLTI
jgi:hypothetical protein